MGVESNRMAKVPPLSSVLRLGCCAALLCHPAQGAPGGSGTQSYRVEGETVGHWAPGHTARWVALLYIAFTPPLTTQVQPRLLQAPKLTQRYPHHAGRLPERELLCRVTNASYLVRRDP